MYFANGRANKVAVMNVSDRKITRTIPVGQRPWSVALSSDGSTLFTADGRSNQISVVDLVKGVVARTIAVGDHPYGIALINSSP